MSKTGIFVLGLIGSILGMVGSLYWIFLGAFFFAGVMDYDLPPDAPMSDESYRTGMTIAFFQALITISLFIVTLVKSTPSKLEKDLKNSGIWLLVAGVVGAVLNLFLLIPNILIIIAGASALNKKEKMTYSIQS